MRIVNVTPFVLPFVTSNEGDDGVGCAAPAVVNDDDCSVPCSVDPTGANEDGTPIDGPTASVANDAGTSVVMAE